jgi:DNA-binding NarL/FixJ family response regulator
MLRVAVVDDHPIALRGLRAVLGSVPEVEVVAAASGVAELPRTGNGAIDADVVVMDLYLEDHGPALAAVAAIAEHRPVLVVSASRHPADVVAALRSGASGYVTKHAAEEVYAEAVHAATGEGFFLSSELADLIDAELVGAAPSRRLPDAQLARDAPPLDRGELSPREREVLAHIAQGFTHQQIARRMGISVTTVNTHVARIRVKLKLGNKAQLAVAALRYPPRG